MIIYSINKLATSFLQPSLPSFLNTPLSISVSLSVCAGEKNVTSAHPGQPDGAITIKMSPKVALPFACRLDSPDLRKGHAEKVRVCEV